MSEQKVKLYILKGGDYTGEFQTFAKSHADNILKVQEEKRTNCWTKTAPKNESDKGTDKEESADAKSKRSKRATK